MQTQIASTMGITALLLLATSTPKVMAADECNTDQRQPVMAENGSSVSGYGTLVVNNEGADVVIRAENLTPGVAYTAWFVYFNNTAPKPRLKAVNGVVMVPAYTDLQLHTMADRPTDPNAEPLDQDQPAGTTAFFAGNMKFITRKLCGLYNSGPFGHSGKFTTIRESITLGHNGEAKASRVAFQALTPFQQDEIIEFLKSLQILPPGTPCLVVDDRMHCVSGDGGDEPGRTSAK